MARCSPVAGTDYAQDDFKREGFNGGIGSFNARFMDHRRILPLAGSYESVTSDFPTGYYTTFDGPSPHGEGGSYGTTTLSTSSRA
jgi:hypothetical protein